VFFCFKFILGLVSTVIETFLTHEWERFKKPHMLLTCGAGAAIMTSITAGENIAGGSEFSEYDQALIARIIYTFVASYGVLRVYEEISDRLSGTFIGSASTVSLTTLLTPTMTYYVQRLAQDPEAFASAGWTAGLSFVSFTSKEIYEVLKKSE
jgi:hypothetical protein